MGASEFMCTGHGATAKEAFAALTEEYRHEFGHGGYSGTIAEKREFVMISVPAGKDPQEFAGELLEEDKHPICDKWGPAGCIKLGPTKFFFFGWASE